MTCNRVLMTLSIKKGTEQTIGRSAYNFQTLDPFLGTLVSQKNISTAKKDWQSGV